jgi:ABC-type glycerol-3-phosphate transport system permease component
VDVKALKKTAMHSVMSLVGIVSVFPVLWMISTAFKTKPQSFHLPPEWIPKPFVLDNFRSVLTELPFLSYLANSTLDTLVIVAGQLVLGALAAYGFARLRFKGRDFLFVLLLTSLMVPQAVTMIPQYLILQQLRWIDTYGAVIVPQIFGNILGIFLLRQYLLGLPNDFEEAARIDGAGVVRTFLSVILPQIKPALMTVGLLSFMRAWNNFLWPLIVINSPKKQVLTVGLSILIGQFISDWSSIMAGATLILAPLVLLYVFAQRYFVESIYMSGLK